MRLHSECCGRFTISTDKRGKLAEFDNLITNGGLDHMGSNGLWLEWCQVGSGSNTPDVSDSGLVGRIAGSNTVQANTNGAQSTEPYFCWRRKTFRFAAGVAAGNLSEVGVGWATSGSLLSRALILDSEGAPTSITILPDEILDVTYEFRFYPKLTDDTGTLTTVGNRAATYDFLARASNVTNNSGTSGWSISASGTSMSSGGGSSASQAVSSGDIGAITGLPGGTVETQATSRFVAVGEYSPGSYQRTFRLTLGLNDGNLAGGIRSFRGKMGIGNFQFQFDPPLDKQDDEEITLDFTHSWGRVA